MSMSCTYPSMEVICAPGGRAPTSDTATDPSGRRNHSMWVNASRTPNARSAAGDRHPPAGVGHELVPGPGPPRGAHPRLHPPLAPDVQRGLHAHPLDPPRPAPPGERTLELFGGADPPLDPAPLAAQAGNRRG